MGNLIFLICVFVFPVLNNYSSAENQCSESGASYLYDETIVASKYGLNGTYRKLVVNGCPNHYSVCQRDSCSGLTSEAVINQRTIYLLAEPVLRSNMSYDKNLNCDYGSVGVALNGVPIYSQRGVGDSCVDSISEEGATFDKCGGHADPFTLEYHYHVAPSCLLRQLNFTGSAYRLPSAQIGWALDGFPIYGPTGPNGLAMMTCGTCGAHYKYCLDSCNGYYGSLEETNAEDGYMYR